MNNKPKKLIILNALAWAGAMLAASYFTRGLVDKDTSFMITLFLITGWFTANSLITAGPGAIREEWACIKRRFGKN